MTNYSFGIVVGPGHDTGYLQNLINSIHMQMWEPYTDKFEIILIGENLGRYDVNDKTHVIDFDESVKKAWITKKKNILAKAALYDNLCIVHDYFRFPLTWTEAMDKMIAVDPSWKIMLTAIHNQEGTRHADWIVNPNKVQELVDTDPAKYIPMLMEVAPHENGPRFVNSLPYDVSDLSHIQYISGGYIFCKKEVLLNVPMNEALGWGEGGGEDVEWSERVNKYGYRYNFNSLATMQIQKPGKWVVTQMPDEFVEALRNYYKKEK